MHVVRGALKEYDWGVVDGLSRWCGRTGNPQAELWFGTHPSGVAIITEGADAGRGLDELPDHHGVPLVKLLAASTPLSIQVHPDADQAARGWAADQGRPEDERRYADPTEKSEMLVSLTTFDVHAGWRDPQAAAEVLRRAGAPEPIVDATASGDCVGAIRLILDLSAEQCGAIDRRLVAAATATGWSTEAVSALARVVATHPADPGVLVTVLLDHARLDPGQGLAVPAGVIHSYVDGLGVEVMTSSDNVLRFGLTNKPIAVEDALSALRPDHAPVALHGFAGEVLQPAQMPFDLVLADHPTRAASGRHRVVLSLHGATRVAADAEGGVEVRHVPEGLAAVVAPGEADIEIAPEGTAIIVSGDAS